MREIPHDQLQHLTAELLDQVASGESILVTDRGRPVAMIGPPPGDDVLAHLAAIGQLREAVASPTTLRSITPRPAGRATAELLADSRGRW